MITIKSTLYHGESSASLLRKSTAAPHPRLCERLVVLTAMAEGLPAKVVA